MKNRLIFMKILALMLVFGFIFTGCPTDSDPPDNNNTDNSNTDNSNTDNSNTDNSNTDNSNTDNGNTGTKYTVTFDASGGDVSPKSIQGSTDGTVDNLPIPEIPDTKKYFWGWYIDKDDWTTKFTKSTPVTADTVVYARWNDTVFLDYDNIWTWTGEDKGVTVEWNFDEEYHSVNVTVGGNVNPEEDWIAQVGIPYLFEKGKEYKFEVWAGVTSGTYDLGRVRLAYFEEEEIFDLEQEGSWQLTTLADSRNFSLPDTVLSHDTSEQSVVFFCGKQTGWFWININDSEE